MTEQELFAKNLRLSREFDLYLLEHREVAKKIPGNALIVRLPEEDANFCRQIGKWHWPAVARDNP